MGRGKEERLVVRDNGLGMDYKGLKQYFNMGSSIMHLARLLTQEISPM